MTATQKTPEAYHPWATYVAACEEARRRGDRRVGTEHLLLALLRDPSIEAALNVSNDEARSKLIALDDEALLAVGMPREVSSPLLSERPLPARPTIKNVMKNRIKLTPAAKRAMQDAGKPMRRGRRISPQQVLLALLEGRPPDPAATLLEALGIDTVNVRERLEEGLTS